jgi:hypothetical protein
MSRLLTLFLALSELCLLPDRVSADTPKPYDSLASEISSRQRCACTWRGPTRIIYHRRYRTAYLTIGYDPCHTASAQQRYGGHIGITGAHLQVNKARKQKPAGINAGFERSVGAE